jgi:hypothetical protein
MHTRAALSLNIKTLFTRENECDCGQHTTRDVRLDDNVGGRATTRIALRAAFRVAVWGPVVICVAVRAQA